MSEIKVYVMNGLEFRLKIEFRCDIFRVIRLKYDWEMWMSFLLYFNIVLGIMGVNSGVLAI